MPRLVTALKLKPVAQISCGYYHSACCTDDGLLFTWGCGEDGQLGHGDVLNSIVPRMVKSLREKITVQIACGYYHTLAIPDTWELYTWGWGENGRLGHGNTKSALKPKRIEALVKSKARVVTAAGGLGHTQNSLEFKHVLTAAPEKNIYSNKTSHSPPCMRTLSGHSACITADGSLHTWGWDIYGQLGHGKTGEDMHRPTLVSRLV